jgi:hypothetical protein
MAVLRFLSRPSSHIGFPVLRIGGIAMRALYYIGLGLSFAVGIWHFAAPYLYGWYSYIPDAPQEIIVSIDYVNYFFSLLLAGLSLLMMFFYKEVMSGKNRVAVAVYGFLVFVWLNRVIITFVEPWPNNPSFTATLISAFSVIFVINLIPFIKSVKLAKKK